jgi:hypothetical protein
VDAVTADRTEQLLDELDHVRCSEGNQTALLAEKIASLRRLVPEVIEAEAWQFEANHPIEHYGDNNEEESPSPYADS